MRAISYDRFGPAADVLELGDVDLPLPGPGEVRVRLSHSGVNPSDAKARAGARPGVTKPAFDRIIPHSDGSGEIDAVGDGVDTSRIGQRVWIWNGQWQRPFGTAAETICLPEAQTVPLPEGVDLAIGATLGIPGLTAAHTVFGGGDVAGQTLLISGGAGAVGHNAVQLAKWGGARVIATARGPGLERAAQAGADVCLDYTDPDLTAQILAATNGEGVDRAVEVEFGQNAAMLPEVMRPSGTICAYGSGADMAPTLPFGPYLFKALTLDIVLIYILGAAARTAAISRLHAALIAGSLRPEIARTYPLAECAIAQDAVMTPGRAGAVLLEI
ncbi:NADPH:quinone reductase [Roseovarius pelagicus]|uniref:NADPH:quinone reductase n=1 Tax=Roseovarius pelagicus TaxID=2980108 RepID=A0ABY6DAW8_9RHOB|nr:NADPH:quinone reductase [Roseovarius pelagicus]UXX83243.1 NADPH:quinone reductase [Roseovarius pelagicus]